jgi:plasmid stabilization system protein ParE
MAFEVVRSRACDRDLEAVFDHLAESHMALGEPPEAAFARAAARVRAIEDAMERLGRAPFQGPLRPDLMPDLRQVTKDRAVFYFQVDAAAERVRVLAVFFGGQDHLAQMLRRLGGAAP